MNLLYLLIKVFCCLCVILGLLRNYMKNKTFYSKFRCIQHIVTLITTCTERTASGRFMSR